MVHTAGFAGSRFDPNGSSRSRLLAKVWSCGSDPGRGHWRDVAWDATEHSVAGDAVPAILRSSFIDGRRHVDMRWAQAMHI